MLQQASERTHHRIDFVGVDTKDTSDQAASFLRAVEVTYPQLSDPDGKLLSYLRGLGLPVTVALDARGHIVGRHIGALTEESLARLIAQAT